MGLQKHIAQWHAEKPFPCRLGCGKSLLHGYERNKHEKNHCMYSESFKQRMGDFKHRNQTINKNLSTEKRKKMRETDAFVTKERKESESSK